MPFRTVTSPRPAAPNSLSDGMSGTLLDQILPAYEFRAVASIPVTAPPVRVLRAVREVTVADIPLARLLIELRYLPLRLLGRPMPGPPTQPITEAILANNNLLLVDYRGRSWSTG